MSIKLCTIVTEHEYDSKVVKKETTVRLEVHRSTVNGEKKNEVVISFGYPMQYYLYSVYNRLKEMTNPRREKDNWILNVGTSGDARITFSEEQAVKIVDALDEKLIKLIENA